MTEEWLPLLDFSSKHRISLSTLRRRIKANTIPFKLEHGKYFILDETADNAPKKIRTERAEIQAGLISKTRDIPPAASGPSPANVISAASNNFVEASVLTSANRLVEEIKSAYAKILQEKEEQIAQLKEEVVDLRMLVRILESNSAQQAENAKPANPSPSFPVTPYPEAAKSEERLIAGSSNDEEFFFSDFQSRDI